MSSVIFVMLDGVRPDAIDSVTTPNLHALCQRGAYSLRARSVMPSITLPCHMSIFHSVPPERHGVVTNDWQPMARPVPGLIDLARAQGMRCVSIYNWEPLRNVSQPGSLTASYFVDNVETDRYADHHMARQAIRSLRLYGPDFLFAYLGTVDIAGHNYGWMSEEYMTQLARVDVALGLLLNALPDEFTILAQADHGGHERTHGTDSPADMTIPWIIAGPRIRAQHEIRSEVSLLDTAPTLAAILGITPHGDWEGRCVDEVFVRDA